MRNCLLILGLLPLYCLAQKMTVDRPDLVIDPDPYRQVYFQDLNAYETIESRTVVVKYRSTNFLADTLRRIFYNSDGNQVVNIDYDDNHPKKRTHFKYNEFRKISSWRSMDNRSNGDATYYSYDDEKRIHHTEQFSIRSRTKDSTLSSSFQFGYIDSVLVRISMNSLGVVDSFCYSDGKLMTKYGGYISKKFEYDDVGNLLNIREYIGQEMTENQLMGVKLFRYDEQNRLIGDSILTSDNLVDKNYQITDYQYEGDLLSKVSVRYKYDYRIIEFSYKKERIKEVKVTTDRLSCAYLRHHLHYDIGLYSGFYPTVVRDVYKYDRRGNRIEKKTFVDDELFSKVEYILTY